MLGVPFEGLPDDVNRLIQDDVDSWVRGIQQAGFLPPPHFIRRKVAAERAEFFREGQREIDRLTQPELPPVIVTPESIMKDLVVGLYYPTRRLRGLEAGASNLTRTMEAKLEGTYVIDGYLADPFESDETYEPFESMPINVEADFTIYNPNWMWKQLPTHAEWFGRIVAHGMRVPVLLHHTDTDDYFYIRGYPKPVKPN